MKLTFHGGVKEVTGANYLLESGDTKILIDCGLKQGSNYVERQNWDPFPYKPPEITAVFVTHTHIDHIGRLPQLFKQGFKGKIYSTPPTKDAAALLLMDSIHVMEQEAKKHNKPPLCTEGDARVVMEAWETSEYYKPITIGDLKVSMFNAGHILGSASILFDDGKTKIIFSGDLGNSPAPLLGDKDNLPECDYVVVESTYGGRVHEDLERRQEILEDLIEETSKAGGVLMIPAFAMERTQEMLYEIDKLADEGRIPHVPIFLDSPLAIRLTDVYNKYKNYLKADGGIDFKFKDLKMTMTTEESRAINRLTGPKVIIAGSGMSNAGRIRYHEKEYLPDSNSTLLIIGFQAEGSLGRKLLNGEKKVKILGEEVEVRAKIKAIGGYSAHADQPQLLAWLKPQRQLLKKIFVVQGEDDQSNALVQKIRDDLAIEAIIPNLGEDYVL